MRQKVGFFLCALLITGCSNSSKKLSEHEGELRSQFPFGLLTADFGILTSDDLAINTCVARPVPYSDESTSYSYWQCFEVKSSKLFCDGNGYDETEKTRVTMMVISGILEGERHEYITRRPVPLSACKAYLADWTRLVDQEQHVCVSGSFINKKRDQAGRTVTTWVFDRFKTPKGCESYFEGECSLKYKLKHGCKLKIQVQ